MKYLSKQPGQYSYGYSLIELIVVTLLIITITALVMPSFISSIAKTGMKTSAKEIAMSFRYARSQAINTKKPYYFYIDLDNSSYWILSEPAGGDNKGLFDAEEARKKATRVRSTSKEIIIQKVEAGLTTREIGIIEIPFYPQGNTVDTKVYLEKKNESNSDNNYEIHLNEITGRVEIVQR